MRDKVTTSRAMEENDYSQQARTNCLTKTDSAKNLRFSCPHPQTHREGRCCRRWAKTAALWCAVCRLDQEPGVRLRRGRGLICRNRGLRGYAYRRRRRRRSEREVAAASSTALGTADAGAAGSAAACW